DSSASSSAIRLIASGVLGSSGVIMADIVDLLLLPAVPAESLLLLNARRQLLDIVPYQAQHIR
ncbi:MAG TPA: hypothetical protein PKC19_01315, partial [Roseiflexaceae bacterium]|nr:hypothetical protein [Roseiflexaceae bacterium]